MVWDTCIALVGCAWIAGSQTARALIKTEVEGKMGMYGWMHGMVTYMDMEVSRADYLSIK